jgi:hypothetical protein
VRISAESLKIDSYQFNFGMNDTERFGFLLQFEINFWLQKEVIFDRKSKLILYCNKIGMGREIRHSIVASIPACHAGDQGSIPCDGDEYTFWYTYRCTI